MAENNNNEGAEKKKNVLSIVWDSFCKIIQSDSFCKMLGPIALIFAAIIANGFQAKMSATSIMTQREQAESQLRASMFSNLIDPIAGKNAGSKDPNDISRIKLLTEMLVLNFHEHFEFKPLLEYVSDRIIKKNKEKMISTTEENNESLSSLHSIARRVINKQIAGLIKEGAVVVPAQYFSFAEENSKIIRDSFAPDPFELDLGDKYKYPQNIIRFTAAAYKGQQGEEVIQQSDVKDDFSGREFTLVLHSADWIKEQFQISFTLANINPKEDEDEREESPGSFTLSWFDFPLTDNNFLKDGNRFSIMLKQVDPENKTVLFRIIWFPKNYFTPRERPLSNQYFLDKLGLKHEDSGKNI